MEKKISEKEASEETDETMVDYIINKKRNTEVKKTGPETFSEDSSIRRKIKKNNPRVDIFKG